MVVLPLLPVIQIILEWVYLPANSISLIMCVPCSISFFTMGASFGMPGLFTTSSAFRILLSVCCPSSHSILWALSSVLYLFLMADISETKTSKPFAFANTAAPAPLSPAPNTTILFILFFFYCRLQGCCPCDCIVLVVLSRRYLIFRVMMVSAAKIMVTIQKRIVILLSCTGV